MAGSSKKGGNGFAFFAGALATLTAGVLINKTCEKNIVDGATNVYDKGADFVKTKIKDHKEKKNGTSETSSTEEN